MSKPKRRVVYWVRWDQRQNCWYVWRVGARWPFRRGEAKTEAVRFGRHICRSEASYGQPTQLRICGKDGRIQTEHTYPRSSDPRRSKG